MPVREVANALLLTYLGTEYLLASGGGGSGGGGGAAALRRMVRSWPNRACLAGSQRTSEVWDCVTGSASY